MGINKRSKRCQADDDTLHNELEVLKEGLYGVPGYSQARSRISGITGSNAQERQG
jgi:hypothetical protein